MRDADQYPLYIEELNKQKAALMAHIETTGSQSWVYSASPKMR